jgi:hypothetical protein
MKPLTSLIALALTFGSLVRADWTIEQKMTTNGGQSTAMTIMVKDNKARMDQGKEISVIMDSSTQEVTTFMHQEKMVMRVNGKNLQGLMGLAGQLLNKNETKPEPTGKKETIAGHECEIYEWKGGKIEGRFWVAKDFPNAKAIAAMLEKLASSMANPIMSMGPKPSDFPGLMICSEIETLGQKVRTEWVSVKEDKLDDKLFAAPEGYEEFKMPQIPNFKIPGQ